MNIKFSNGLGGKLFIASGCDKDDEIDSLVTLDAPKVKELSGKIEISFIAKTTCWERIEYTFECLNDRVLYGYKVHGNGKLENARFSKVSCLMNEQFGHRAKVAHKVCPSCYVRTDQHPIPSLHAWRKYMPLQPQIGKR